jgi:hypothetical protein
METAIYIIISVVLIFSVRVLDAIKSGCFYAARRREEPKELKKYMDNLHFVQTPFWYCLFGAFFMLLFTIFRLINPEVSLVSISLNLLYSWLIAQGTSAIAGYHYQKYINIGSGVPAIDPNENKKMEFANPFTSKTIWIRRFWRGKIRYYLPFIWLPIVLLVIYLAIF